MHYQEADVFDALKSFLHQKETFDLIILDPPAFIKKRKDIEQGIIAYLRLNELALQLLSENGILISCSCSLHLPQEQLTDIIRRASLKTKRKTRILEVGLQGMDHPIHPAIPETAYLKALFCFVTT
jgi:23S rRNA (cytosine1962-C5)-methyltransferase